MENHLQFCCCCDIVKKTGIIHTGRKRMRNDSRTSVLNPGNAFAFVILSVLLRLTCAVPA